MDFISAFDIELDKTAYYAGELVTGHVIVENCENIKVQAIRVFIRGKAHCQWKITRAGEKRTVKDDEYYIDHKQVLWGKNVMDDGPIPILPRGLHRLPIEYQLPESNLPCSFESKIGRIRYYIRVVIIIPYASHPQGIKYFSVLGPHIDCMNSNYLTPTTAMDKRKSCCFCFFGGPMVIKAVMERSAYCSGEKIKLHAEVQNGCDQKVWLICRFIQHVEYFINRGVLGLTKEYTYTAWEYETERVLPHHTVLFDNLQDHLQVPVTPPTLIDVCGLLKIYYELTVSLRMDRSAEDLEVYLPITVATVPFRIPNTVTPQLHFEFASPNVEGGTYISPEFQLGQVYMGDDIEENDKTIIYRPMYCTIHDDECQPGNVHNVSPSHGKRSSKNSPRTTPKNSPKSSPKHPRRNCTTQDDVDNLYLTPGVPDDNESLTEESDACDEKLLANAENVSSSRKSSSRSRRENDRKDPNRRTEEDEHENCVDKMTKTPLLQPRDSSDSLRRTSKTSISFRKNDNTIETISLKGKHDT